MKIGDLVEFADNPYLWGIIVGMNTSQYEVYWQEYGARSWIVKKAMVKKCP